MADNTERIAEIDAILRSGVRQHTVDGDTVVYDFDALRKERNELIAADDSDTRKRPRTASIKLGGV